MVSLHLFDNYSAVWSSTADAAVETGNRFAVSNDSTLDELRWYRRDTTAGHKPEVLRCWDLTVHAVIAQATSIPDNGAIGWQTAVAPDAITLLPGHVYCVTAYWPDSTTASNRGLTSSPIVSKPAPLIASGNTRGYHGSTLGEPTSSDSVFAEATDVGITDLGPGEGSGSGTLTGDLNSWLNASAPPNVHDDDGLPWLTKALLDAWNSGLGSGAVGYFQFMKTAINAVKERTDRLPDSIEALTNAILTNLSDNTDLVLAGLATIQAGVDSLTGGSGGTAGGALGAISGRSAFPGELWTMADETDWETDLAWPVAADLYVCTITTPPPATAADSFAGVTWYHRLGSWTTLDGDQAGARAFLEFSPQQLQDGGRRMPGLALRTKNGTLGHVQAWVLA